MYFYYYYIIGTYRNKSFIIIIYVDYIIGNLRRFYNTLYRLIG